MLRVCPVASRRSALLLLIRADELALGEHVSLHRLLEGGPGRCLEVAEGRVEGVELVEVAVASDRGPGPAVPRALPVVEALAGARRESLRRFGEAGRGRGHVIDDPMHPGHP